LYYICLCSSCRRPCSHLTHSLFHQLTLNHSFNQHRTTPRSLTHFRSHLPRLFDISDNGATPSFLLTVPRVLRLNSPRFTYLSRRPPPPPPRARLLPFSRALVVRREIWATASAQPTPLPLSKPTTTIPLPRLSTSSNSSFDVYALLGDSSCRRRCAKR
jgi:hypothetical protein